MNENHYPAGSSGGKGGQFAPKNASGVESSSFISYVPKTTLNGSARTFFADLPVQEQARIEKEYMSAHKDIISTLDYFYDNYKTNKINTDERNFMRQKWINDEFNEQMSQGPKKQERKATLILGLPGSGKSTIASPIAQNTGSFIVDADNFKNRIPEFQKDKKMVSAVHHESVDLANNFQDELAKQGYNLVVGKVGGDYQSVNKILDTLANNDYDLDVVLVDVPWDVAKDRTIGRYDRGETDRLIPFWTTKVADKNVFKTFEQVLKNPIVKNGKIYSNDVKKGEQPILLKDINK